MPAGERALQACNWGLCDMVYVCSGMATYVSRPRGRLIRHIAQLTVCCTGSATVVHQMPVQAGDIDQTLPLLFLLCCRTWVRACCSC